MIIADYRIAEKIPHSLEFFEAAEENKAQKYA